ncbi:MAG: hypothetical protein GF350_15585 [Chitinivibrionales bacterium]|nr:hypothetical protein [Chitinivibrionales bacterium]
MKKQHPQSTANELYEIADSQQGYFTAAQARSIGISDSAHPYHVRRGNWIREWRGIYRLARYPESNDSHLVLWALWSRNRQGIVQGIYSHETALRLFEISDVNPAKLHMTVPPNFRRTADIPKGLVLHEGIVEDTNCEQRHGYKVMKPLPTILALIKEGLVSMEIIRQALKDGIDKGILIRRQILNFNIDTKIKDQLAGILDRL